jgi:tight adherence protein C
MFAVLIALGLFAALAAAITYFGYNRYARPGRLFEQLGGQAAAPSPIEDIAPEPVRGPVFTAIEQVGGIMPVNADDAASIRSDLAMAGYRSEHVLALYLGIRILACGVLVLVALLLRSTITSNPILSVVFPIFAGLVGFFGPGYYLEHLGAARQERIRESLPDALDLMVVAVEAGLGLDQAIQHVGRELSFARPEISEELQLVNLEIRAGKRRIEALRNLAIRTGETELRKLVAVLIQTDRFGTSVSDSLRTHSEFMRTRRRQEAEERAGKVGVKLVFPIFFLVMPSMLVVAAGPGLLQVFKYLFPLMQQFRGGQ